MADALEMNEDNFTKLQADNAKLIQDAASNTATVNDLQASVEGLENKSRELLGKLADGKKAAETERLNAAKTNGDIESIENSWKEKLTAETASRDETIGEYKSLVNKMTVGAESLKLASELAVEGSASALLPHIKNRLSVEIVDGEPKIRVLGADGKPSALTLEELGHEISETKSLAPLISGSKASGSGEVHTRGVKTTSKTIKRDAFNALSPSEQNASIADGVMPTD